MFAIPGPRIRRTRSARRRLSGTRRASRVSALSEARRYARLSEGGSWSMHGTVSSAAGAARAFMYTATDETGVPMAMTEIDVQGYCPAHLSGVRDEFVRNFVERGDVGAAVAVTVEGEMVVDLWAGHADAQRVRPWERDTIVNVYSTTKGMTALCAHMLIDRDLLDIDEPVATYWPEFAQAGKESIPVRWLLTHRAGLTGPSERLTSAEVRDWNRICAALAATKPWWEPNTMSGYHALTFGFLVERSSGGLAVVRSVRSCTTRSPNRSAPISTLACPSPTSVVARHDSRRAA